MFFQDMIDKIVGKFSTPSAAVWSCVDILLLIALIYIVVLFFVKSNAERLIKYLAILVVAAVIIDSDLVNLPVLGRIFSGILLLVAMIITVVFSPDIRRSVWKLASHKTMQSSYSAQYDCSEDELQVAVDDIVRAVQNMSKMNVGALIVIVPDNIPEDVLDSGTRLDADLSCSLIECLFNTKAPLHDGAVYIRGNKILAAGCFLPLTQKTDLDKELGTRHRAAIGITEQYNNHLVIIVSEETGIISVARGGEIMRYFDTQMLTDVLQQSYGLRAATKMDKHSKKCGGFLK